MTTQTAKLPNFLDDEYKLPETLYHFTGADTAARINKTGLQPRRKTGVSRYDGVSLSMEDCVYLGTYKWLRTFLAHTYENPQESKLNKTPIVIYAVKTSGLDVNKFLPDEDWLSIERHFASADTNWHKRHIRMKPCPSDDCCDECHIWAVKHAQEYSSEYLKSLDQNGTTAYRGDVPLKNLVRITPPFTVKTGWMKTAKILGRRT
jgi:hypothetical protein